MPSAPSSKLGKRTPHFAPGKRPDAASSAMPPGSRPFTLPQARRPAAPSIAFGEGGSAVSACRRFSDQTPDARPPPSERRLRRLQRRASRGDAPSCTPASRRNASKRTEQFCRFATASAIVTVHETRNMRSLVPQSAAVSTTQRGVVVSTSALSGHRGPRPPGLFAPERWPLRSGPLGALRPPAAKRRKHLPDFRFLVIAAWVTTHTPFLAPPTPTPTVAEKNPPKETVRKDLTPPPHASMVVVWM